MWTRGHVDTQRISEGPHLSFSPVKLSAPGITRGTDKPSHQCRVSLPHPPGIPVLMPGVVITPAALDYLRQIQAIGGFISGCADAVLEL